MGHAGGHDSGMKSRRPLSSLDVPLTGHGPGPRTPCSAAARVVPAGRRFAASTLVMAVLALSAGAPAAGAGAEAAGEPAALLSPRQGVRWAPQTQVLGFTPLAADADDTVNPLRGYHRWRGQEVVPQSTPSPDAYQRYAWRDLEPELGRYDFTKVLADAATARSQGRRLALRVRSMLGYDDGQVYLPRDLVAHPSCSAGCGWWADADPGNPQQTYVPDWNDPFVHERMRLLLQALGQALGTSPLAWVDVGLYGQWGEWTLSSKIDYALAPGGIAPITNDSKRAIAEAHFAAMPDRPFVMFALKGNFDTLDWALNRQTVTHRPVGLRIDCLAKSGFMNQWTDHPELWSQLQNQWQRAPFVAEFCPFDSGDALTNAATALQQVRDFRITSVSNGNLAPSVSNTALKWASFTAQEQATLLQIGREAGHRLMLDRASYTLSRNGALALSTDWRNPGRAPVYESWEVTLELLDDTGAVRQSTVLPIALSTVGADNASLGTRTSIALNNQLPAGRYLARLVIRDPLQRSAPADARAPLRLAIAERQADGGVVLGTWVKR